MVGSSEIFSEVHAGACRMQGYSHKSTSTFCVATHLDVGRAQDVAAVAIEGGGGDGHGGALPCV